MKFLSLWLLAIVQVLTTEAAAQISVHVDPTNDYIGGASPRARSKAPHDRPTALSVSPQSRQAGQAQLCRSTSARRWV